MTSGAPSRGASHGARPSQPSRPLIVELVGPAGAGKTALLRSLRRDHRFRAGLRIDRVRHFLNILIHAVLLVPIGFVLLGHGSTSMWYGMLHFVRLRTLPSAIARASRKKEDGVILLDEGPIFSLGRLTVFQEAGHGDGPMSRQWHAELNRWSSLLDAVVWIDAPDAVLTERIRSRPKDHQIKTGTDAEVADFLDRYRRAYEDILSRLKASGAVRVIELDTSKSTTDETASRVAAELERLGLRRSD